MQSNYKAVQGHQATPAFRRLMLLSHCALFALGISLLAATNAFGAGPSAAGQARGGTPGSACGEANQDRGACLREEAAAREEMKKGKLESSGDSGEYTRNALARCGALPAADRTDCERRVRGDGKTSGSVAGGGVYRELVTPMPADGGTMQAPAK